jgi:hypothetical protein
MYIKEYYQKRKNNFQKREKMYKSYTFYYLQYIKILTEFPYKCKLPVYSCVNIKKLDIKHLI